MSDQPFTYNSAWEDGYRHAVKVAATSTRTRTLAEALGDVAEDVWVMQTNSEDRMTTRNTLLDSRNRLFALDKALRDIMVWWANDSAVTEMPTALYDAAHNLLGDE